MNKEGKNTAIVFQGVTFDFGQEYANSEFIRNNLYRFQRYSSLNLKAICEGTQQYNPLLKTMYDQPAIFAISLLKAQEQEGHSHEAFMGHSFGELASLTSAKVIEEEAGMHLAETRGVACAKSNAQNPGSMAVLYGSIEMDRAFEICANNGVYAANINIPGEQVVISGKTDQVSKACQQFQDLGLKVIHLNTGAMFHSPGLAQAQEEWRPALNQVRFTPPSPDKSLVMISTGNVETDPQILKECLLNQLTHRLEFEKAVDTLTELQVDEIHEVATKKTLTGFIRKIRNRFKR